MSLWINDGAKADNPRPDDPTTAAIKGQMEIEQMKQDRQREADKATLQLKQQELQMRDQHEQAKIASNEKIKMAELMSRSQDDESRANLTNLKAMNDREKHQSDHDGEASQHGSDRAEGAVGGADGAAARQSDMAQRGQERRAAQQFKNQGGASRQLKEGNHD